jgi:hypothetical protein
MKYPPVTKIRAVAEDFINDPMLELYEESPDALAEISASRIQPNTSMKEPFTMSLTPEYVSTPRAGKIAMPGIGHGSPARLLDALTRLGLCTSELATPLKTISAAGQPMAKFFQVNVWELDKALAGVECTIENRINFKNSLDHLGILNTKA